jgi:thiamine-phosphate pyrophosphorylase
LQRYQITDPEQFGDDEVVFRNYLDKSRSFDYILYRDKSKKSLTYIKFAKIFIDILKAREIGKFLIHSNFSLAKKLDAFGVHLTSSQFSDIEKSKELGLFTVVSCHSLEDVEIACKFGADAVTFSPIFQTPNKGEPKGVEALQNVVLKYPNLKVFALGGVVSEVEIRRLKEVNGLYGFASIRFFI